MQDNIEVYIFVMVHFSYYWEELLELLLLPMLRVCIHTYILYVYFIFLLKKWWWNTTEIKAVLTKLLCLSQFPFSFLYSSHCVYASLPYFSSNLTVLILCLAFYSQENSGCIKESSSWSIRICFFIV